MKCNRINIALTATMCHWINEIVCVCGWVGVDSKCWHFQLCHFQYLYFEFIFYYYWIAAWKIACATHDLWSNAVHAILFALRFHNSPPSQLPPSTVLSPTDNVTSNKCHKKVRGKYEWMAELQQQGVAKVCVRFSHSSVAEQFGKDKVAFEN